MEEQGGAPPAKAAPKPSQPKGGPPGPPKAGSAAAGKAPAAAAKKASPPPLKKAPPGPPGSSSPPAAEDRKEDGLQQEKEADSPTDVEHAGDRHNEGEPDSAIRVLYLHSLEASHDRKKVALLEEAFGRKNVRAPPLGARRTMALFGGAFLVTALLLITLVIMTFLKASFLLGVVSLLSLLLVSLLAFFLAWRGVTQLIVRQAVLHAEKVFSAFKPNVIVAPSYGAVVAFQMDAPKVPLVLLSPAQDVYYRYMHLRPLISLAEYPYSIVVSGSKDGQVPLDDAIRLVETAEIGRCRLEVIDDDHGFSSLKAEDFRNWVEEAFQKGGDIVREEAAKGNKHFDPRLFELSATEGSDLESGQ